MPLVRRTRATLRNAEFGFFGVVVYTRTHTPRFCGQALSAGAAVLWLILRRPNFTSWLIVGISVRVLGSFFSTEDTRRSPVEGDAVYFSTLRCQAERIGITEGARATMHGARRRSRLRPRLRTRRERTRTRKRAPCPCPL